MNESEQLIASLQRRLVLAKFAHRDRMREIAATGRLDAVRAKQSYWNRLERVIDRRCAEPGVVVYDQYEEALARANARMRFHQKALFESDTIEQQRERKRKVALPEEFCEWNEEPDDWWVRLSDLGLPCRSRLRAPLRRMKCVCGKEWWLKRFAPEWQRCPECGRACRRRLFAAVIEESA